MSNDPIMGLSLSDNTTLEYVLSDIPFFCVGLTALAVFAFFLVMRRINLPTIYLYTSSLLAFVAAILDLSQVLLRGTVNTDQGLGLSTVTGIVDTREVLLALSFGFRYLYLWAFVAQRPRYEPRPRTQVDPLFSETYLHSASWERWGAPGFVLKFALLGSVISIPILQIIWRIATGFSTVYIAEATIQIAVSVLLIAKLMLNLFLSTVSPWWRPFTPYIIPIIALMISTGIGTGNLLLFKFSETTLGRFLQAVETYSLILSVLIFTFYNVPQYMPPSMVSARKRSSFGTGLPPKTDEPYPVPVEQNPVMQIGRAVTSSDRPGSRESAISRISSWINVRRAPRPNSGEQKLWNAGDAELGISTELREPIPAVSVADPTSPRTPVQVVEEKQRPPLTVNTKEPQNLVPPTPNTLEVATPSTISRPFTGVSFASYYGMATSSRLTMPSVVPGDDTRNTDSPVYGLNGIIRPSAPAEPESPILSRRPVSSLAPPTPSAADRESMDSFDELLRQQTELDKSIAALRLFSPTTAVMSIPAPPEPEPDLKVNDRALIQSMSSSKSASNRSEFSLSIFPDPPPVEQPSILPGSAPLGRARDPPFPSRARRQSRVPRSAVSDNLSAPASPERMRFDSAATQYDVTSFIGNLTIPGSEPKVEALDDVAEKAESESDVETPIITSNNTASVTLRPLLLSSMSPTITSLPPATASSGVLPLNAQPSNYEYPVLKPLLLGSAAPAVPSPLSVGAGARRTPGPSVFAGPRKPTRSGGPRPIISVPRQLEDEQAEEAEAFEKPRRPPAFTFPTNG
ncbi:hypothetical protein B0H19DRAFT_1254936 [Mycena capillaripes]|nr:hypothetical protein B0H19DRAFT_1254936 [Mycena capillaripes]